MFKLNDIQTNEEICLLYLNSLELNKPLKVVIKQAHELCLELKNFCEKNENSFKADKSKDKGSIGKIVEFKIFGQLPNCEQKCDLLFDRDIKTTTFKLCNKDNLNAKERLTITNVGKTENYETFNDIINVNNLTDYKHYEKIRKGLLIVQEYSGIKYATVEEKMDCNILKIIPYDIENLPKDYQIQIQKDFEDIQNKIRTKTVSQSGQKYLHIHPHGSKKSSTRAFGFTNKFVTILVSLCCNIPITQKGKSIFINKIHFK